MGTQVSKDHASITVKHAPVEEAVRPDRPPVAEGYEKALFMSTHTSFAERMPAIKEQLRMGVRGLEFVVHVMNGQMHLGRSSAGEGVNVAANEEVAGSTLLEPWLASVAAWSRQREGAHTPLTLWLTLTNSFAEWGDFSTLNMMLLRVFGAMLFTPDLLLKYKGGWPSLDEMTGRVIVVLGGVRAAREGYRADLCDGDPAVCLNTKGQLIVAHERAASVVLWLGQYISEDERHLWEKRRVVCPGRTPAVSVNDNGLVVLVHSAQTGVELFSRIGRLVVRAAPGAEGDELDIEWLTTTSTAYDVGLNPSVAINNLGAAIVVHSSIDSELALGWRAALLTTESTDVRWLSPEEVGSPLQRLRVPGRSTCTSVSFEQPYSSDITVVHQYTDSNTKEPAVPTPVVAAKENNSRMGSTMFLLGSRTSLQRRGSVPVITSDNEGQPQRPGGGTGSLFSGLSAPPVTMSTAGAPAMTASGTGLAGNIDASSDAKIAIRGIARISQLRGGGANGSSTPGRGHLSNSAGMTLQGGQLKVTWAPGAATAEKPLRSRTAVGEGAARTFARATVGPTSYSNEGRTLLVETGPMAQQDSDSPAVVRLPQLCFVEAQRSEATLLSDPEVRFVGCAPRDEAFAMSALEQSRVLRMWRFNAASCKRSSVNPNFPATDFPESDWYLAYLNACGS